jgi:hypothetical protein
MTTYTAFNLAGYSALTTAQLQAEMTSLDTMIANGGWVQSSDTGQMVISSVTYTASVSTAYGYRVYYFNDTQHASYPIYLKLSHRTNATGYYEILFELGHATDGAGNIMGWKYPFSGTINLKAGTAGTTDYYTASSTSWASYGDGYSWVSKNLGATNLIGTFFGLTREWVNSTGVIKTTTPSTTMPTHISEPSPSIVPLVCSIRPLTTSA